MYNQKSGIGAGSKCTFLISELKALRPQRFRSTCIIVQHVSRTVFPIGFMCVIVIHDAVIVTKQSAPPWSELPLFLVPSLKGTARTDRLYKKERCRVNKHIMVPNHMVMRSSVAFIQEMCKLACSQRRKDGSRCRCRCRRRCRRRRRRRRRRTGKHPTPPLLTYLVG